MDPLSALHDDIREIRTEVRGMRAEVSQAHAKEAESMKTIVGVQERHQALLDEHIRRTEILEATVKPLNDREAGRAALTRVAAAISGLLLAGAAACEIFFHLKRL